MTLKEFLKKIPVPFFNNNERKEKLIISNKISLVVYPAILLITLLIYTSTYNLLNNQKKENEKNLENFFNSKEFVSIKSSFLKNLKSPYEEFSYKIENNDSVGKILRKFRISESEIQKIIEGLKEKNSQMFTREES